jgi:Protein of unknown function (DUF1822)
MSLNLELLQAIEPESIWLEIAPAEIDRIQPHPQLYSNQTGLSNAKLNQLCLDKFQAWLTDREISFTPSFTTEELTTIWDVVTGCAIEIGKIRLILIPTEIADRDELSVFQEWVDLPNWLGDYYLNVQVDTESGLMNIWGFASHQTLKEQGEYNPLDRSYSLDSDLLVSNLDLLWIAEDLELDERMTISPVPQLSLESALSLIQQVSIPSPYSPRLQLDFASWGAILNNPSLRNQLYQTRLQTAAISQASVPSFRLFDWVRDEFTNALADGWQSLQESRYLGASVLRSSNTIERAKLIDLQLNLRRETVVLLIGVIPENNERMRVLVQVHPGAGSACLPPQLQLSYVDEHGAVLRTVTARRNDLLIQLPAYTCPVGMEFNIQLQLYSDRVIERFMV